MFFHDFKIQFFLEWLVLDDTTAPKLKAEDVGSPPGFVTSCLRVPGDHLLSLNGDFLLSKATTVVPVPAVSPAAPFTKLSLVAQDAVSLNGTQLTSL